MAVAGSNLGPDTPIAAFGHFNCDPWATHGVFGKVDRLSRFAGQFFQLSFKTESLYVGDGQLYAKDVKRAFRAGAIMLLATDFRILLAQAPAQVPVAVLQELRSRGCKPLRRDRKDVITGEFYRPGQTDWAALCVAKNQTSLLAFPQSARERVTVLQTTRKGFSKWSISVADRERLKSYRAAWGWKGPEPTAIDHQGISSVMTFRKPGGCLYCFSEQNAIHFHHEGQWLTPVTIIVN